MSDSLPPAHFHFLGDRFRSCSNKQLNVRDSCWVKYVENSAQGFCSGKLAVCGLLFWSSSRILFHIEACFNTLLLDSLVLLLW